MLGRSAGLLALVSFLLAPSLILTQDVSLARILPRFPVGPPSTHLPVRIVHPPRAALASTGRVWTSAVGSRGGDDLLRDGYED